MIVSLSILQGWAQTPSVPPQPQPPPVLQGTTAEPGKAKEPSRPGASLPQEAGADETITINTTLVTVPVSVLDAAGNYVTDLGRDDFRLYEDGVEQRLAVFNQVTQPICVVLLIDASGSVRGSLPEIKAAALAFAEQLQPTDYVFPIIFSGSIIPLLPQATNDKAALRKAIQRIEVIQEDATSIYDAVQAVNEQILRRVHGRKALILFTDGEDVTSRKATLKSSLKDAQEMDALIYTVQYPRVVRMNKEGMVTGSAMSPEHGDYLKKLAEATGGRYYKGESGKSIRQAFASIAEEMRRQYVLGYYPNAVTEKGEARRLKIAVNRQGMSARTRKSLINIP